MKLANEKTSFYCATIAYHVELNAYSDGRRQSANVPEKMDEIMMARCLNTVGEPRSEIPHASHLFLIGRIVKTCILLQRKDLFFFYGYTCHWVLKLHQFLY